MRTSQTVREFFEWRWAPCVALTAASLAWVGLAVLIIPSQLGSNAHTSDGATAFNASPVLPNTAFNSALTQTAFTSVTTPPLQPVRRAISPPAAMPLSTSNDPAGAAPIRRGFSPPIEQPEAPPPPPAPPSPAVPQVAPPPIPAPPVNAAPPPTPPAEPTPLAVPVPPPTPQSGEDANQAAPAQATQ